MIRTHIRIAHIATIRTGSPVDSRQCDWGISKCLGIHQVFLGFNWIHRNVDKKYFFKSKKSEKNKIMIWGIQYTSLQK